MGAGVAVGVGGGDGSGVAVVVGPGVGVAALAVGHLFRSVLRRFPFTLGLLRRRLPLERRVRDDRLSVVVLPVERADPKGPREEHPADRLERDGEPLFALAK